MGKNSPSFVLKRVFKDISNIENIIQDSKEVKESFDEINFDNDIEVEKVIQATKLIVSSLKVHATKLHNYFHDNYKTWKNEITAITNGKDSSNDGTDIIEQDLPTEKVDENKAVSTEELSNKSPETKKTSKKKKPEAPQDSTEKDASCDKSIEKEVDIDKSQSKDNTDLSKVNTIVDAISTVTDTVDKTTTSTDTAVEEPNTEKSAPLETPVDQSKEISAPVESPVDKSNETVARVDTPVDQSKETSAPVETPVDQSKEKSAPVETPVDQSKEKSAPVETPVDQSKETSAPVDTAIDQSKETSSSIDTAVDQSKETSSPVDTAVDQSKETSTLVDEANETPAPVETPVDQKVFIKCVDIKKLVNPGVISPLKTSPPKNRASLNDSVFVISDSEEETSTSKTKFNKTNSEKTKNEKIQPRVYKNMRNKGESTSNTRETRPRKCTKENSNADTVKKEKTKQTTVSEDDSDTNKKGRHEKRKIPKKITIVDKTISDTSSMSDSDGLSTPERKDPEKTKKQPKKRYREAKELSITQSDKKFSYKAYVGLPRIPCEKLKEHYLKQKEIAEVKRLANLNNLKRGRKNQPSEKKDQSSSSDTENIKPKSKKKRAASKTSNSSDGNVSAEEPIAETTKETEPAVGYTIPQPENNEIDQETAEMIVNESDASSAHESDDDSKKKKDKKGSDKKESKKKAKDDDSEKETGKSKEEKEKNKEKTGWRKDKLLTSKISESSDSEDELLKFKKRTSAKPVLKLRKKIKNVIDSSDSESETKKSKKKDSSGDEFEPQRKSSSSDSDSEKDKSDKDNEESEKKKRRRIKRVKESSSDGDEEDKSTRKTIRRVIGHESLAETTKRAEKEEQERKARILERQKKYNKIFETNQLEDATVDKLVLDFNEETQEEILAVHPELAKKLKPHQVKGVQYMWDACYESVERVRTTNGSGCILAHCMGLGKTLQVITLVHTLLTHEELTKTQRVLVVCPVNTVLNWVAEFKKWLDDIEGPEIEVFDLVSSKVTSERKYQVSEWTKDGGVLVLGYDMFRNLTNPLNKRLKKSEREVFHKGLVNPGADLVVCDEGHLLKNEKTNLSIAMNRIHTVRRIVLTGTPMQNNMKEYYCMVQFVKPNLLGTYKEYLNRFVNPITNGQYTDSTDHDINIMRKRSHVLHKMLDGVVQRKDYAVLMPYLPPKYEYVLFLTLTEVQIQLYRHYLEVKAKRPVDTKMRTTFLFMDFQQFQRICTHPRVLLIKSQENAKKAFLEDEDSEGSLKDFIDDNESGAESSSSSGSNSNSDSVQSVKSDEPPKPKGRKPPMQRVTRNAAATLGIDVEEETAEEVQRSEWWGQYCSGAELENISLSSKLYLLFEILQQCELIGDKLLVFSQSLYSLNIIEYFLAKIDEATQKGNSESVSGFSGSWALGLDYFRLDGSSSCDNRSAWCKSFNSPDNPRARLFLISTKAGGLGINLIGANRVVIFDVSWNPSHDIQSIYRVYRFGQTKPCYIYRFVTNGTMEMKIYERQVTKQAISKRIIDEQQIDRHYNQTDLAELYNFDPKPDNQPTPLIPKDVLLAELLQKEKDRIFTYHEHQSLLENKEDEELNEAERKAAWEEFESEKTARVTASNSVAGGWIKNLPITSITAALISIVQKDNATWAREQVNGVVPLIVQQLKEQVEKGEMLLFNRIVTELKLMQASQQQRLQEYYMQQQLRVLQQRYAQQQQRNAGPSMSFNFENAVRAHLNDQSAPEIVELND